MILKYIWKKKPTRITKKILRKKNGGGEGEECYRIAWIKRYRQGIITGSPKTEPIMWGNLVYHVSICQITVEKVDLFINDVGEINNYWGGLDLYFATNTGMNSKEVRDLNVKKKK